MHKRWFITVTLLCTLALVLSCIWLISPAILAENYPFLTAQTSDYYQLVDVGGYVGVLHVIDGAVEATAVPTDIFVNLLTEQDALRIKAGYTIAQEEQLTTALNTLRNGGTLP